MGRRLWGALLAPGVVGLYGGARVLGLYWDYNTASAELPQAVRDYRAAGLPWTAADLDRHVAPADNAAPLVRRAIAAMPGEDVEKAFDEAYAQGTADPAPYGPALALFHEAARLPDLDFGRDWDLGGSAPYPEPASVKQACKVLATRAENKAAHGDDGGALSDLEDARRLGDLLGKEPSTVGARGRVACERFVHVGVQRCLSQAYGRPDRLARYRRWLDTPALPIDERAMALGEIYLNLANARNLDRLGLGRGFWASADVEFFVSDCSDCARLVQNAPRRRDGLPENVRTRAYLARFLQIWTEFAEATHGMNDSFVVLSDRADVVWERRAKEKGLSYVYNPVLDFGEIDGRLNLTIEACRSVSRAFADALIAHSRKGRWPKSMNMRDPLGKGSLHVRFGGKRFRVWSVGPNGSDDGGLMGPEAYAAFKSSDDLVAVYPSFSQRALRSGQKRPFSEED